MTRDVEFDFVVKRRRWVLVQGRVLAPNAEHSEEAAELRRMAIDASRGVPVNLAIRIASLGFQEGRERGMVLRTLPRNRLAIRRK